VQSLISEPRQKGAPKLLFLSKFFAFPERENRSESFAPTFGRKYGILARSKNEVFAVKKSKIKDFEGFLGKKCR
jgi:hypothetical protein